MVNVQLEKERNRTTITINIDDVTIVLQVPPTAIKDATLDDKPLILLA
jgi:hypothetical protein